MISKFMKKAGIEPRFIEGRRVTDKESIYIIDKALHSINQQIVKTLKGLGTKAFGLSGRENGSLSDRIVSRYGNSAEGMVEAAQ